jgi:hypothetical protein
MRNEGKFCNTLRKERDETQQKKRGNNGKKTKEKERNKIMYEEIKGK